jgi:hypothetical protein
MLLASIEVVITHLLLQILYNYLWLLKAQFICNLLLLGSFVISRYLRGESFI